MAIISSPVNCFIHLLWPETTIENFPIPHLWYTSVIVTVNAVVPFRHVQDPTDLTLRT